MRERTFRGVINGTRFSYTVILPPALAHGDDPSYEKYQDDHAQRKFADNFVSDLIKRGEIVISTEQWDW